jgi:hypothetical protein
MIYRCAPGPLRVLCPFRDNPTTGIIAFFTPRSREPDKWFGPTNL